MQKVMLNNSVEMPILELVVFKEQHLLYEEWYDENFNFGCSRPNSPYINK